MCAEALSTFILKAECDQAIHGIKICPRDPQVSHLFDDDNIIFSRGYVGRSIQTFSHPQNLWDGIWVGYQPWQDRILMQRNVPTTKIDALKGILGVKAAERHQSYLGLPTFVGRSK